MRLRLVSLAFYAPLFSVILSLVLGTVSAAEPCPSQTGGGC